MHALIRTLVAAAVIAMPASGTPAPASAAAPSVTAIGAPAAAPIASDPCGEAMAQALVSQVWYISSFLLCPTGACIPFIEAAAYAVLLSTAYALTVCAI